MWIALNNAFLPIVDKGGNGSTLLVRARVAGDIERVSPRAEVAEGEGTDYRFRARINRDEVADAIARAVRAIDYGNFKDSVREADRHDAYVAVRQALYSLQCSRR